MKSFYKHLSVISCWAILSALVLSCTVNSHQHTFSKKWTTDETHHWHKAICGHEEMDDYEEHSFGEWVEEKAATEDEAGLSLRVCSVCEYTDYKELPKIEHEHQFSTEWSSDKTNHWHAATCSHSEESTDKTEHKFSEWETISPATELETGSQKRECSICGYIEKKELSKLEHNYSNWKIIKEATASETGLKERQCTFCNHEETETIPVLGHIHSFMN